MRIIYLSIFIYILDNTPLSSNFIICEKNKFLKTKYLKFLREFYRFVPVKIWSIVSLSKIHNKKIPPNYSVQIINSRYLYREVPSRKKIKIYWPQFFNRNGAKYCRIQPCLQMKLYSTKHIPNSLVSLNYFKAYTILYQG